MSYHFVLPAPHSRHAVPCHAEDLERIAGETSQSLGQDKAKKSNFRSRSRHGFRMDNCVLASERQGAVVAILLLILQSGIVGKFNMESDDIRAMQNKGEQIRKRKRRRHWTTDMKCRVR